MNDQFGHSTGDALLCTVATPIRTAIRDVDIVARLGGDEFAILFPETDTTEAMETITRIRRHLSQAMKQNRWPVTFI